MVSGAQERKPQSHNSRRWSKSYEISGPSQIAKLQSVRVSEEVCKIRYYDEGFVSKFLLGCLFRAVSLMVGLATCFFLSRIHFWWFSAIVRINALLLIDYRSGRIISASKAYAWYCENIPDREIYWCWSKGFQKLAKSLEVNEIAVIKTSEHIPRVLQQRSLREAAQNTTLVWWKSNNPVFPRLSIIRFYIFEWRNLFGGLITCCLKNSSLCSHREVHISLRLSWWAMMSGISPLWDIAATTCLTRRHRCISIHPVMR